jgi:hypothetical protein
MATLPVDTPGVATADGAASQAAGSSRPGEDHNKWDFLIVLVVVIAMLVLTIFLAVFFRKSESTTATILGIVVPVFAAVFGASLGHSAGRVTGREQGIQFVKARLLPTITSIQGRTGELVSTVRMHAENPQGSRDWLLTANFADSPVHVMSDDDMDQLSTDLRRVQGYLEGL